MSFLIRHPISYVVKLASEITKPVSLTRGSQILGKQLVERSGLSHLDGSVFVSDVAYIFQKERTNDDIS